MGGDVFEIGGGALELAQHLQAGIHGLISVEVFLEPKVRLGDFHGGEALQIEQALHLDLAQADF